jgi:HSP20 family protein
VRVVRVARDAATSQRAKEHTMSIMPWSRRDAATDGLARLREEMDRSLERFFSEPMGLAWPEPKSLRSDGWLPAIDVSENANEVTIKAELPGIAAKDLDITLSGRMLSISGQKREKSEQKDENFYHCERRFGSFRRVIELPEGIDPEKVTAEAENGVVTIHVARKPGAKPRPIEIKSATAPRNVPIGT